MKSDAGVCNIQRMKLSELIPAEYNPRTISDKAFAGLGTSLEHFGMLTPIVWNKRSGNIVGGHQRYKYLVEAGETDADVVVVDLDGNDEVALNVALNSKELRGQFTADAVDMLKATEAQIGSVFAKLRLVELHNEIAKKIKKEKKETMVNVSPGDTTSVPEALIVCPKCQSKWKMKDNTVVLDTTKGPR